MRRIFYYSSVGWVLAAAFLAACGGGGAPPVDPDPVGPVVTGFAPTTVWARVPTPFVVTGTGFEKLAGVVQVTFTAPGIRLEVPGTLGSDGRITGTTPVMPVAEVADGEVVVTIGAASLAWDGRVAFRPPQVDDVWPTPVPAGLGAQPLLIRGRGFGLADEPVAVHIEADSGSPFAHGSQAELLAGGCVTTTARVRCRCPAAAVGKTATATAGIRIADAEEVVTPGGALTFEPEHKLTADDGAAGDWFGSSVALSGETAIVGAYKDYGNSDESGSAYVFVRNGTTWTRQQKLTASDGAENDHFGHSVALSGNTSIIGADGDGGGYGSAYVFVRNGTTWTQQQKLTPSDGAALDLSGYSVALSGDTAIAGAPCTAGQIWDNDDYCGSAYVFVHNGATWSQQETIKPSDGAAYDWFGCAVALSGNTAIVGASLDDDNGGESGSAYVFVRSGTTWTRQQKLTASDGAQNDHFGHSVALSGNTAIIGADGDDDHGGDSGSAYVFVRSGTTWTQQRKLTASDGAEDDHFGYSVAVSEDTAIVGACQDDDDGSRPGSAYVFTRSGTTWTEQGKLTAADGAEDDSFGSSVALSGDTAVVGAYGDDDNGEASGSAYVWFDLPAKLTDAAATEGARYGHATGTYGEWMIAGAPGAGMAHLRRDRDGAWVPAPTLVPPGDGAAAEYGTAVALSSDLAVVGAPHDDEGGVGAGAVYVYAMPLGDGTPAWPLLSKLVGHEAGEDFGRAVAVYHVRTPDGEDDYDLVVVGAPLADVNGNEDAGAVYVFKHHEGSVTELATLTAADPVATDEFGNAVAVSGERIAVGAWRDDDLSAGPDTGAVYVFTGSEATWDLEKRLTASDPETKDHLGISVALSGSTLVAGAFGEGVKGARAGAAYVFERVEILGSRYVWKQRAKLVAPDGEAEARFGRSVAVLGNVIAVGAPYQDDSVQGVDNTGAVYLFRRCGETWAHDHTWTAWDGDALDTFGYSVALGSEHVVASAAWDDDEAPDAGAVYVHLLR